MRSFHVISVGLGLFAMVFGAAGEARAQDGGWTDDGTVVRLTTRTDRVGIGTATPIDKLHVIGNARISGRVVSEIMAAPGNTMLHLRIGGRDALRLDPTGGSPNIIGGADVNVVNPAVFGGTIAGGGDANLDDNMNPRPNVVTDDFGSIGGGRGNQAGDAAGTTSDARAATVGGGEDNTAGGRFSTVGGGVLNTTSGDSSTVGGGVLNAATGFFATVGGGSQNVASGEGATVGGGGAVGSGLVANVASGVNATVGGGTSNTASNTSSTVGGGKQNSAIAEYSTVGGGRQNLASGFVPTVGGGFLNVASGSFSTVAGGFRNTASGHHSFAAGKGAKANHQGSFVWADSTSLDFDFPTDFSSQVPDQFLIRANGGTRILKGSSTLSFTLAALQVENAAAGSPTTVAGEAAWLRTTSNSNTQAVIKLLKHPSGTNNFLECENFAVASKCHINANGTFVAGSDFAEALPARGGRTGYEPGDVLVLSGDREGVVEKATRGHDARVAGVYSTRPAVLGADKDGATRIDPDDIPVAIVGIVPTKVSAENGAIKPGDLLTTATVPGHAMKASPVMVSGVALYPTGTILGKALSSLESGTGLIRVLVTLK